MLPVLFVLVSVSQVLVLRFVDPPFSTVMAGRQLSAWAGGDWKFGVAYDWRDLERMAPSLPLALIAAEDQNFAEHYGFDFKAIEKARRNNARGRKLRGASTISQQVAKNLFLWPGQSWLRKGLEAWFTVWIELLWPKQRILEVYLNVAQFGRGTWGVEAASRRYFRKPAADLTRTEAALLASVLPSPTRYRVVNPGPYVRQRQQWILGQMNRLGGPALLDSL